MPPNASNSSLTPFFVFAEQFGLFGSR
jgi:hypothetical protein